MKKILAIALSAVLVLSLTACGQSAMQKATSATATQSKQIEDMLEETGVDWETIEAEPFELTGDEELDFFETAYQEEYTPFHVTDRSGGTFLLVINNDKTVVSIVNKETGEQLYYDENA